MTQNPFWHYSGRFDALETLNRYMAIAPKVEPREGLITNFLGVAISPSVHPAILGPMVGTVDAPPPAEQLARRLGRMGRRLPCGGLQR